MPTEPVLNASKDSNAMIAAKAGIPSVGAVAINRHGIAWKVHGHTHATSLATQGEADSELTLYPVVFPENLSPKLTEFLLEVARCTPKSIVPLDTLPHLFPKRAHPGGHSVDSMSDRYRILLFLDCSDACEAVIAHELAHVWIELVQGIEDYRVMRDTYDSGRYAQIQFLQSFVLDVAVDRVLTRKGFDTSIIELDKQTALAQMGLAASSGYKPATRREAVYMASFLATSMLEEDNATVLCVQTAQLIESRLPEVYRLSNVFKQAVQNSPPADAASAQVAIDQVLTAAFEYTDGGLDLDSELVDLRLEPCWDQDKNPDWLPGVSVKGKCEVGLAMARHGATSEARALFERTEYGRIRVRFQTREGGFTPYTELEHVDTIPDSPETRMRQIVETNQLNLEGMHEGGLRHPNMQPPGRKSPPGFSKVWGRSYSPGMARFLTAVRLQEFLGGEPPYGYANNSPLVYTDPSGLEPQQVNPFQNYNQGMNQYINDQLNQCFPKKRCIECLAFAQSEAARKLKSIGVIDTGKHDRSNAIGHCTVACIISRTCPDCIDTWNDREAGCALGHQESCRDLHNNRVGMELAKLPGQCADLCKASTKLRPPK